MNTTHPPKPDNPPNEHRPNGLPPNQTFQTTHPPKQGLFPPRRPTRQGHHVPYTRFGGCVVLVDQAQGKTRDHAATHTPPDPRLPATYMRTKQIWHHTPASAGVWQY
ncbi:hypothetical protein BS47DRAFT_1368668 [Hydnum rufescens UP504]|uniref:Uncharacterized protein n=1 Tax=Hydnum rufescens UP504 TaxID=1448309 RepID=A0A9P6AF59_9AGAM|nr:hypothetical protein BS47DRAFT_1368668 [Hydnum rufescens UP504]